MSKLARLLWRLEVSDSRAEQEYFRELANVAGRDRDAEVCIALLPTGELVGAVTLVLDSSSSMSEWEGADAAGFRMLAVAPDAQGQGIGRALSDYCVMRARDAGKKEMLIHSRDIMYAAQKIYKEMGFARAPNRDFEVDGVKLLALRLGLEG